MNLLSDAIIEEKIPVGTRLAAMLLDHVCMTGIMMLFFIPTMAHLFDDSQNASYKPSQDIFNGVGDYLFIFGFSLYFCKDIIQGRSIAKRILKLQLVSNSTGKVANPLQCVIRNLFCILWPIEVIVGMVNTSRRIGDQVAGTKLVVFNPTLEQPKLNIVQIILALVLANGFSFLITSAVS